MAVRLSPKEEAEAVVKVWKDTMTIGEYWAVVDAKWWRSWLKYTGLDTDRKTIGDSAGSRPSIIDNSRIQESKENPDALRVGIQEGEDFALINREVWDLVVGWYEGGPTFIREVIGAGIPQKASADLFPFVCKLFECDEKGSAINESQQPLVVSRRTTVEDLIKRIAGSKKDADEKEPLSGEKADKTIRLWIPEPPSAAAAQQPAAAAGAGGAGAAAAAAKKAEAGNSPSVEAITTGTADVTMTDAPPHKSEQQAAAAAAAAPPGGAEIAAAAAAVGGTATDVSTAASAPKIKKDGWKLVDDTKTGVPLDGLEFVKDQEPRILVERKKDGVWPRKAFVKDWRDFQKGDVIDCEDTVHKWYESTIVEVKWDSREVHVHFNGWASTWDEWLSFDSSRMQPRGTYSQGGRRLDGYTSTWDYGYGSSEEGVPTQLGAVGLRNLGNTCFMNSTLQCLSQSPTLTEYFVEGRYLPFINRDNPLGWKGRIADEYGALLKEMWSNKFRIVAPKKFKQVLGEFAPRFGGYQQQDSSELLSFLLDGLHEDLNQVKVKPPTSAVESNDRTDEVVSKEAWDTYLKRNRSIVVDWLQGQLKSKLVCPVCGKISITFDPFMFLSAPLPMVEDKVQDVYFVSSDPSQPVRLYAVTVSKVGRIADLKQSLEKVLHLPTKRMVICEVFNHRVFRFYEDDASMSEIRANEFIYCYDVPQLDEFKAGETVPVQICHMRKELNPNYHPSFGPHSREYIYQQFALPRVIVLPRKTPAPNRLVRQLAEKAIAPSVKPGAPDRGPVYKIIQTEPDGRNCLKCNYMQSCSGCELENNEEAFPPLESQYNREPRAALQVIWNGEADYDGTRDMFVKDKSADSTMAQKQDVLQLADCIRAFTKEEILSEQDPWYCSKCKEFRQASKKFDVWA